MAYRTFTTILLLLTALLSGSALAADTAKEYVPDDDKGPEIGAAPTGSNDAGKNITMATTKEKAVEFVPDDDKGPEIGAAPTK